MRSLSTREDEGLSFSNQPIKPKKILIVTIGTLAGLIVNSTRSARWFL